MGTIEEMVERRALQIANEGMGAQNAPVPVEQTAVEPKTAREIISDLATEAAMQDEDLRRGVTDRKKAALLNSAEADMKREEAANKEADLRLQEANFGVYSGVANYAGIKRPLPEWMQKILFSTLSAFQMIFLMIFGLPVSIINIVADGIDSVIKKLSTLTKSAMWIVIGVFVVGAIAVIAYVVRYFLIKYGIV